MKKALLSLLLIFLGDSIVFGADSTTIVAYYPSPYGSYTVLSSDQMAIGSGYRATTPLSNGLIVASQFSIGRTSAGSYGGTQSELDVNGEIAVNDVWVKNKGRWLSTADYFV